jgi:hypothetical protein
MLRDLNRNYVNKTSEYDQNFQLGNGLPGKNVFIRVQAGSFYATLQIFGKRILWKRPEMPRIPPLPFSMGRVIILAGGN